MSPRARLELLVAQDRASAGEVRSGPMVFRHLFAGPLIVMPYEHIQFMWLFNKQLTANILIGWPW